MNVEKELVRKYFKIKNPNEEGILKVVYLEDAVEIVQKAVEEAKKTKWIDIEKQKPLAWEKGEWDGDRTDFVLIATDKREILIARAYENFIGGIHTLDWVQKDDFDVKGNVTHWQKISEHPFFIS